MMVTWKLLRVILLLSVLGLRRVTCQSTLATVDNESSECPSTEKDLINLVLDTRKAYNHLRHMVENLETRLEIALTGVTQLLQQIVVQSSASNASSVEMRLETVEIRLENLVTGVEQLLQQTQQSLLLINGPTGIEPRLETIETRLDNLGTEVEQLLQHTSHCPCNCNGSSHITTTSFEEPLDVITAVTGRVTQLTPQSSTNDDMYMLSTPDEKKMLLPGTPTLTYSLSGSSNVYAVALLNDQLFVSRYDVRHVLVYGTRTFQLQRQLTIPGLGLHVFGLATCASNNVLYVSDYVNKCVHKVDLSITNTNNVIKWNVASYPAGLSVNRARNVLVTSSEAKKVQEYTPSGSLVREISDSNYLWHAVELNSGMLAVSRLGPINGVAMVTMDGHVIHSYGNESRGSGVGQMNEPRSIAVDKDGYILVADQDNHRILIVNPMMTDSRLLPLPVNISLQYPRALSLDQSRGRLYVGEWSGQYRVLVFDNVTNVRAFFN